MLASAQRRHEGDLAGAPRSGGIADAEDLIDGDAHAGRPQRFADQGIGLGQPGAQIRDRLDGHGQIANQLSATIDRAVELLQLPSLLASPAELSVTLHHDRAGKPKVLFAINPTECLLQAKVAAFGAAEAEDALDGSVFRATFDAFELPVPPRTVRLLALRF